MFLKLCFFDYNSGLMEQILKTSAPIVAAVAIVAFALPTLIAVIKQRGFGRGLGLFAVLGALAFAIEAAAVKTGLLYGNFKYSDSVGYRVLDSAPWLIALAVPPIMLGAFWLANKVTSSIWRVLLTAIFILPVYVVIAPGVTRMSVWQWETAGIFFGVPLQAYGAWFLSGLISGFVINAFWGDSPVKRSLAYSSFILLWFWGGVNLGLQQYIPGAIGVAAGLLLVVIMWLEKRTDKKEEKIDDKP